LNIRNYIDDVLVLRERLQLTGLGTLKIVRQNTEIEDGKFSPREARLLFTSEENIAEEDILSNAISEGEEISLDEAREKVLEYIDTIKFEINRGNEFEIRGICILYRDEDSSVRVRTDPSFLPDPDSFGLESFELTSDEEMEEKPVDPKEKLPDQEKSRIHVDTDQDMRKFEETYIDRKPAEEKKAGTPEPSVSPVQISEVSDSESNKKSGSGTRRVLLISSAAVILILAAVLFIPMNGDSGFNKIDFGKFFEDLQDQPVPEEEDDMENQEQPDDDFDFEDMVRDFEEDIDSATEMENALSPGTHETTDTEKKPLDEEMIQEDYVEYHIIAGSFKNYENAREVQKELTLLGYPSIIIEPGNGIFRVSAISFRDKTTALNELVKFRDKTGRENAWLMNLE